MPRPDVFLEQYYLDNVFPEGEMFETSFVLNHNLFHIGTPVIKWTNKKGFDGYDEKRSITEELNRKTGRVLKKTITGKRYSARKNGCNDITQIMIHHTGGDGNGAGRVFNTLHNQRGLSVHFVVDDDGTIWQFLDCKEKAWHGGRHNKVSIGIECNLFPLAEKDPDYYSPERCKRNGNIPHVIAPDEIHGRKMNVFSFTEPQVEALARLCAGLWVAIRECERGKLEMNTSKRYLALGFSPRFPRIRGDIAKTAVSRPMKHIGLIGHLQATRRKIDPAGFPWLTFETRVAELYFQFINNQ